MFRNETNATERRAKRGLDLKKPERTVQFIWEPARGESIRKQQLPEYGMDLTVTSTKYPSNEVSGSLSIPVEDQAPCFFIANFCRTTRANEKGAFDFLLPIIKSEAPESPISLAFAAVSFASLANRPNARGSGLMIRAVAGYGKALRAINIALQTPSQVKTDATLASILLLGFYEVCTGTHFENKD